MIRDVLWTWSASDGTLLLLVNLSQALMFLVPGLLAFAIYWRKFLKNPTVDVTQYHEVPEAPVEVTESEQDEFRRAA